MTENAPGEAQVPRSLTPDGSRVLFRKGPNTNFDLGMLWIDGSGRTEDLLATAAGELNVEVSPNGRWIAYQSDRSGRVEIYVSPFPDAASSQRQVSVAGDTRPAWARDGSELFDVDSRQHLMAVRVGTDLPAYSFLLLKEVEADEGSGRRQILVQNWFQELKRLVPTE